MKQIIYLVCLIFYGGIFPTSGFFFKMTTEAPTTVDYFANKPIIIHHHHKWKVVQQPAPTTEAPWTWQPHTEAPPQHWQAWDYPKWNIKPVEEPPAEEPPSSPWKPYWHWPATTTTTTTEAPKWEVPPEVPQKWAYKRESTNEDKGYKDKDETSPNTIEISPRILGPLTEAPKTTVKPTLGPKLKKKQRRVLVRRITIPSTTTVSTTSVNNINNIENFDRAETESFGKIESTEAPIADEVDINWSSQNLESVTVPTETTPPQLQRNILYKYIYKVHSPATKDIKMHHEESDGNQVIGHYSLVEPDGSTRVVYYTAGENGFNADVKHFDWSLKTETKK